jgi:beta-lactamase regulating signal transducer with metallopeptidase domain
MTSPGESNLLLAVGWAVFNSLWQMAILWVAYQFITTVFKINKSSQKGFLSAVLLFAGFLWFAYTLIAALASPTTGAEGYTALLKVDGNTELGWWLRTMLPIASILYMVLLILPILNFIRNYRYVQVIRRYGLSRASVEWRMFVQRIAGQMGIRKTVHIWMSELISSPVTIGFIKPIILLPIAAVNHLSTHQIEAVLLHELSHIKRLDYLVNLVTRFIQTILYFNPFVKEFTRIIEREREKSCDETVMQFQYEPHGYASALLVLEKAAHVPQHSLAVAASDGKKSEFRQRIEWIMGIRKKQAFSYNKLAGVFAALLLFIALNALMIFAKPATTIQAGPHSFSLLEMPLQFSTGSGENRKAVATTETHAEEINNHPEHTSTAAEAKKEQEEWLKQFFNTDAEPLTSEELKEHNQQEYSPYQFVYDLHTYIPQLTPSEEKQVQKVLNDSKQIIGEIKWKEVEATIADAMTSLEKAEVKEQIKQAIASVSTLSIEQKLAMVYDKIDWNNVTIQIQNELAGIKMDSLQHAYTAALGELRTLHNQLVQDSISEIPDTDITLQSIEKRKVEFQRAINKIKTIRPKKIVRL